MDIWSIILISLGLAMDCFAVSLTKGLCEGKWHARAVLMALLFGLFQGGMPLAGFAAGKLFASFFSQFAPWIALGLLAFIGGKMIWESLHEEEKMSESDWRWSQLLLLAVATSIDALATGVIFIPCPESVILGVSVIALGSLVMSLMGYLIGVFVGNKFHVNMELIGGLILVGLGLKIWIEGLFLS